jgi:hypothetical protein
MKAILKEKVADMIIAKQTELLNTNRNIFTLTDIGNMLNKLVEEIDLSENLEIPEVVENDNVTFSEETREKFEKLFDSFITNATFSFDMDCVRMETNDYGNEIRVSAEIDENEVENQVRNSLSGNDFIEYAVDNWFDV